VLVVDGDGSLQMQLGVLAAIAGAAPPNLVHIVIDNGIYAISGGQPTAGPIDWQGVMLAAGYAAVVTCDIPDRLGVGTPP
jgi:phosphonopyruvate decarboxylase